VLGDIGRNMSAAGYSSLRTRVRDAEAFDPHPEVKHMYGKRGSMLLCLGNLPAQITRRDLKLFVQEVVGQVTGSRSLRISTHVPQCSILRVTDTSTGRVIHQGLIAIQPAKVALEAMPALRRTPFKGYQLQVRRYRHGSFELANAPGIADIADLLGLSSLVDGNPEAADPTPALKVDLVSTTGAPARPLPRPMTRPSAAGILAH
jgi:hypothetical protein